MYNGIGILSVRGSGTSGYVQGNKFNLRGGRPVQNRFPDNTDDKGPTQRQPDESILLHNHKREVELKLLAEEDKLAEQGLAREEIDSKVAALRLQLDRADQLTPPTEQGNADETHAAAKRQLEKMVKLRTVFGLPNNQDSKEGEAFDRELQEKRKQARIEQRELAEKTKIKQAKALKKEAMRREKERARAAKKAVKDAKKQEKQRQKEHLQRQQQREQERRQEKEQEARAAERARAAREAPVPERYVPRARPNTSPSPPPKRQRREDASTEYRRSSQLTRDEYRDRDGYRSRDGSRSDVYPTDRHDTARDDGHDAAAMYGDRRGHSSRTESVRQPERNSGRDSGRAPYGDRHYGDRDRTRESDRERYGDRGRDRSQHNGDRREERGSRLRDSAGRHASPVRDHEARQQGVVRKGSKQRRGSSSSSSASGSSSGDSSGSSTSGSSGTGSSGSSSSDTSSSGQSR
ncbi:hypothetical protein WJX79_003161 [Trebouxia sp. C0005]